MVDTMLYLWWTQWYTYGVHNVIPVVDTMLYLRLTQCYTYGRHNVIPMVDTMLSHYFKTRLQISIVLPS